MENKDKVIETETVETETEVVKKEESFFKRVGKKVKSGVDNWLDKPGKTNREKLKTVGTIGAVVGATALAFLVGKEVQRQENDNLLLTDNEETEDYGETTETIETETVDDFSDVEIEEF